MKGCFQRGVFFDHLNTNATKVMTEALGVWDTHVKFCSKMKYLLFVLYIENLNGALISEKFGKDYKGILNSSAHFWQKTRTKPKTIYISLSLVWRQKKQDKSA